MYWVVTTELFPADLRASGMSVSYVLLNCLCFIISLFFPHVVIEHKRYWPWFAVVTLLSAALTGLAWWTVPETFGLGSVEDTETHVWKEDSSKKKKEPSGQERWKAKVVKKVGGTSGGSGSTPRWT